MDWAWAGPWHGEVQVAQAAVMAAAQLTQQVAASRRRGIRSKADASVVTAADLAAQAVMTREVRRAFPDDGIVGEENGSMVGEDAWLRAMVHGLYRRHGGGGGRGGRGGGGRGGGGRGGGRGSRGGEGHDNDSAHSMLALLDQGGRGQGGAGRVWVMDPVDGTAAYVSGGQYAVALALLDDGIEQVGVVACPRLREGIVVSAVRGRGVQRRALSLPPLLQHSPLQHLALQHSPLQPLQQPLPLPLQHSPLQPLQHSPPPPPSSSSPLRIVACAGRQDALLPRLTSRLAAVSAPGPSIASSHVRYMALVTHAADILVRLPSPSARPSCIWDHAGACLIVTEAGGCVTDLDGRALDFGAGRHLARNRGLVATMPAAIHAHVLGLVNELAADDDAEPKL